MKCYFEIIFKEEGYLDGFRVFRCSAQMDWNSEEVITVNVFLVFR